MQISHLSFTATYFNISKLYQRDGNFKRALKYSKKSLTIGGKIYGNNSPILISNNILIAEIYNQLNEYEKALKYFKVALKINKKTNNLIQKANIDLKIKEIKKSKSIK